MLPLTPQSHVVQLAREELNLRPTTYKVVALTTELRASALSRAGRIRVFITAGRLFSSLTLGVDPCSHLIKSQGCCLYTTTRWLVGRIRLHRWTIDIV